MDETNFDIAKDLFSFEMDRAAKKKKQLQKGQEAVLRRLKLDEDRPEWSARKQGKVEEKGTR